LDLRMATDTDSGQHLVVWRDYRGVDIYSIRGRRVMLDSDLAALYGVETRALNQAVRRNLDRFERKCAASVANSGFGCEHSQREQEGMKLSPADLQRLQTATGRYVKLPDSGWVELDSAAVQAAHEAMADLGVDGLVPVAQKVGLEHVAHLDEEGLKRFADSPQPKVLRERVREFKGVAETRLPQCFEAQMRPYQQEGFNFLCHLANIRIGAQGGYTRELRPT
jgi:hypothetical protein